MVLDKYVGKDVLVAKYEIKRDNPLFDVEVIANDEFATMDLREDRIRIYYDRVSKLVKSVYIE